MNIYYKGDQFFLAFANLPSTPAFHVLANKRIQKEKANYNRLKSDATRAKRLEEFRERLATRKAELEARRGKRTFRMTLGKGKDLIEHVYTKLIQWVTE